MLKGVASEWRQGYQDEAKGTEHGEAKLKEQPEMKKRPEEEGPASGQHARADH